MDMKLILVVDDEQGIRDIMKEYLLLEDFEVIEAVDGVDGINKFKNNNIASDINILFNKGLELLNSIVYTEGGNDRRSTMFNFLLSRI